MYITRAKWPERGNVNFPLAIYSGSQIPLGKEEKVLSFPTHAHRKAEMSLGRTMERAGMREGGTVVCFPTSG